MTNIKSYLPWLGILCLLAVFQIPLAHADSYDPLALPGGAGKSAVAPPLDLTVQDEGRHRELPLRVYLPAESAAQPVILFSPGLGGSRESYVYLCAHWAGRGYVAVCLQHPGSDDALWRGKPPGEAMAAMQQAVGVENFMLRNQDVKTVLDQLGRWNDEPGNPLAGRLDLARVGMAGHSFGAVTTQAVSGQTFPLSSAGFTDQRIKAALMMSPSVPTVGDSQRVFGSVGIPWMLMTGTEDNSPIGNASAASRLAVYEALPPGGKYELVLDGAEHSAFSDRPLPGDQHPRDQHHQQTILALSTAFWDAKLRGDAAAGNFLDGKGARAVLAKGDLWKKK